MIKLPDIRGEYRPNFPLSHLTWFKVGGNAEILFKPADPDDLSFFLANIAPEVPIYVIGAGSNLIIRDGGVNGVVIKLGKGFTNISKSSSLFTVGAGTLNYNLAQYALQNSVQGFEFLVGIPGTIGGGIAMNAGSYGSEFKDIIHSITMLDRHGRKHILFADEMGFEYRKNGLKDWRVFVEATFYSSAGDKEHIIPLGIKNETSIPFPVLDYPLGAQPILNRLLPLMPMTDNMGIKNGHGIKARMDEITQTRKTTQPVNQKTGGSTFANPRGHKAWELIDQIGMRGYIIGGAQFSPLHCNFMVNIGNATAADLEELGEMARSKVLKTTDIDLHWEIKRIGITKIIDAER